MGSEMDEILKSREQGLEVSAQPLRVSLREPRAQRVPSEGFFSPVARG